MLRNVGPSTYQVVRLSLFLSKKEKMTPNQELSRPHSVLPDEQFFLMSASSLEGSFRHREVVKTVKALLCSAVFCESFGVSTTLILTGSQRFQRNPRNWNI